MGMSEKFPLRKFVAPEFVYGYEAHKLAGQYARNLNVHKVLLVTDPGVIQAGWAQSVVESLEKYNIDSVLFSDISPIV